MFFPPSLSLYKTNSKCIKDLSAGPETLKLLLENIGKTLEDIGHKQSFSNRTSITQEIRPRIDK
jgi:hypothetical protein